jgi:hypothetical protein
VHVTTVGYWERNRFFPEQHWAALNKLLHISLTPPGETAVQEPEPSIPPEVLRMIRNAPRDEQWKRDAIEALEAIGRERRAGEESQSGQRAG